MKAERWEIRTRPLGCRVSTITTLTSAVSVASTAVLIVLILLFTILVRWLRKRSHEKPGRPAADERNQGKWNLWRWRGLRRPSTVDESAPLLSGGP